MILAYISHALIHVAILGVLDKRLFATADATGIQITTILQIRSIGYIIMRLLIHVVGGGMTHARIAQIYWIASLLFAIGFFIVTNFESQKSTHSNTLGGLANTHKRSPVLFNVCDRHCKFKYAQAMVPPSYSHDICINTFAFNHTTRFGQI